ncbi:hypothetical protein B0A48_08159 [Cryoendolithus antarcticus]|uniref:DNA replication complex GINS protein PSF1 n=1 Tax=Cryoendolithus antarcticus TaxID=1507870 RepID=A0A1V8T1F8_9PEZI|nr:hypothetical protein B0A48_08159 [Cryoendolithus antarcticus]
MSLGDTSQKLIESAARISSLPTLPPYATALVRAITQESRDLERDIQSLLSPYRSQSSQSQTPGGDTQFKSSFNPADDPALATTLMVNHVTLRRNKRCLLVYHRTRIAHLEKTLWSGLPLTQSSSTPSNPSSQESNLTPSESLLASFLSSLYSQLGAQYPDIDLLGSITPPREVYVEIRVLREVGEVQTEYGSLVLGKNSVHFVRLSDVEGLVRGGVVEVVGEGGCIEIPNLRLPPRVD